MTRTRNATTTLSALAALLLLTAPAAAQTPLLEIETSAGDSVLHVNDDGGLVARGAYGSGSGVIPAEGAGTRMMWHPEKGAFRAGVASGTEWDDVNIGDYSVAFGRASASGYLSAGFGEGVASGNRSAAFGSGEASGASSFATGSSTASGPGASGLGTSSVASGDYSFAAGRSAIASGYSAIAIGHQASATDGGSIALGWTVTADGYGSVALGSGSSTTVDADWSLAGPGSSVTGYAGVALGSGATAGSRSFALGSGTDASGGYGSVALGWYASVSGQGGVAINADYTNTDDAGVIAGSNQFVVRAHEVWFGNVKTPTLISGAFISTETGAYLSDGGTWTDASSRTLKENFASIAPEAVLEKVADLSVTRWNYKVEGADIEHIGPVAEDFHAAFGLGADDEHIAALDVGGVSLLSIQALTDRTDELRTENETLRAELQAVRAENETMEERLNRLEALVESMKERP